MKSRSCLALIAALALNFLPGEARAQQRTDTQGGRDGMADVQIAEFFTFFLFGNNPNADAALKQREAETASILNELDNRVAGDELLRPDWLPEGAVRVRNGMPLPQDAQGIVFSADGKSLLHFETTSTTQAVFRSPQVRGDSFFIDFINGGPLLVVPSSSLTANQSASSGFGGVIHNGMLVTGPAQIEQIEGTIHETRDMEGSRALTGRTREGVIITWLPGQNQGLRELPMGDGTYVSTGMREPPPPMFPRGGVIVIEGANEQRNIRTLGTPIVSDALTTFAQGMTGIDRAGAEAAGGGAVIYDVDESRRRTWALATPQERRRITENWITGDERFGRFQTGPEGTPIVHVDLATGDRWFLTESGVRVYSTDAGLSLTPTPGSGTGVPGLAAYLAEKSDSTATVSSPGSTALPTQPALSSTISFNQNTLTLTELYAPFNGLGTGTPPDAVVVVVPPPAVVDPPPVVVVPPPAVVVVPPPVVVPPVVVVPPPVGVAPPVVSNTLQSANNVQFAAASSGTIGSGSDLWGVSVLSGQTVRFVRIDPATGLIAENITGNINEPARVNPSVVRLTGETGTQLGNPVLSHGVNSGRHIAFGEPVPAGTFPTSGTFNYNFVAMTAPTFGRINGTTLPGTLTGSAAVDFSSLKVGVAMTVTMPTPPNVLGALGTDPVYTIQTPGGTANPAQSPVGIFTSTTGQRFHFGFGAFTTSPNTCTPACPTRITGHFYGAGAAFTSILFQATLPTASASLNGAIIGQKQ